MDGDVYAWGLNCHHEAGVENSSACKRDFIVAHPSIVKALPGKVVSIAVGRHHTIVSTESGECFTWGCNDSTQLGVCPATLKKLAKTGVVILDDLERPVYLTTPQGVEENRCSLLGVVQVAAAGDKSFAVTSDGIAPTWVEFKNTFGFRSSLPVRDVSELAPTGSPNLEFSRKRSKNNTTKPGLRAVECVQTNLRGLAELWLALPGSQAQQFSVRPPLRWETSRSFH